MSGLLAKVRIPWLWIVGLGAGALAVVKRKDVAEGAEIVTEAAGEAVDALKIKIGLIPSAAQTYASLVEQVASEEAVQPLILIGIGWRETKWGSARELDQQGPSGTGDFIARTGKWLQVDAVQIVDQLPHGWYPPRDGQHNVIPGPYAIPADGRGWGRGLMQIDYERAVTIDWEDPYTNIREGARIFKEKVAYIENKLDLTPDDLIRAGLAAYNHGEGAIVDNLRKGRDVDFGTSSPPYSADVVSNIQKWS